MLYWKFTGTSILGLNAATSVIVTILEITYIAATFIKDNMTFLAVYWLTRLTVQR